jgi:mono/diheme cytochrome c family protein
MAKAIPAHFAVAFLFLPSAVFAESPPKPVVNFARDVRPLFQEHCYKCHGPDKRESGLRLDRKADALAGGDHGPALLSGERAAQSRLLRFVAGLDEKGVVMPPKGEGRRLTEQEVATLRAWAEQGLDWPDGIDKTQASTARHWSFKPIRRPAVPTVRRAAWVRNPIDAFVLSRLETQSIDPAPESDRRTLVRRLHLDLLGLLPKPQDVEAFVNDTRPDAYEKLVDRLLASQHFGERWTRHWLDLVRYAESDGYENDNPRPNAFRYRDWVIGAINRDMPFDQFTIEQLAGDLLPNATLDQRAAAGVHRSTLRNTAAGADPEEFRTKAVKDRTNTTGGVWLGLTAGCAQCHTHKYDPITQREYYGLYAFFNDVSEADVPHPQGGEVMTFKAERREARVHVRGDFLSPGAAVDPHTPEFLPPLTKRGDRADRLDLARWLMSPDNPLTARVAVNHVWQHLLGKPIVPTPDNFGTNGEPPTHPELLDWLAAEFISPADCQGAAWSRKRLIRLIVTSATYRQSSQFRPELIDRDPGNTLLARQNRYRVDAEVVRDLSLAVSGLMNDRIGGPSVQPPLPLALMKLPELKNEKFMEASTGADRYRRGLYIHAQRTFPHPTLQVFDAPDGNESCARRDRSNTPMQALTLLNDPAFIECAQTLAKRLIRESPSADAASRISFGWQLCLGRAPAADELKEANELLSHHLEAFGKDVEAAKRVAGDQQAGATPVELAAWTGVARMLLNVEEFYARE